MGVTTCPKLRRAFLPQTDFIQPLPNSKNLARERQKMPIPTRPFAWSLGKPLYRKNLEVDIRGEIDHL